MTERDEVIDRVAKETGVSPFMVGVVLRSLERTHCVIPVELYERFVRAVRVTEACHNCASGAGVWFDEDELTL